LEFLTNTNVVTYLIAYLIGGIPFGLLLAKRFAGVDIKASGSKSIGATNVLRVVKEKDPKLAKKLGAATLILDALKGALLVLGAKLMGLDPSLQWAVAVFAVIGHCYSPYLMFEGGKGVATGLGVVVVMLPLETLAALVVWVIAAKVIRISSLSSMLALLTVLIASYILHPGLGSVGTQVPLWLIVFIIMYKHVPNFVRLLQGQEKRIV